ncbi:MAG: hypothetical protein N4A41_01350 [Crocinitomicaceae bacterium]|nr:hypothetical protein [Crocinitomicaceae bacterium]
MMANDLFLAEKYVEATPYYLRLLSLKPRVSYYNYRYGACLLFNSDNKQEALRYLKFAVDKNLESEIDPMAFYYLGRAYHYNYLFNDAIKSYKKFKELTNNKVIQNLETDRLIQMCENGKKLLSKYSEIIVYEKKEIEKDKFFRLYELDDVGGELLVTEEFQSKLDKKYGHVPIIFFAKGTKEIYYSSYGDDGIQKDIYRRRIDLAGNWGVPQKISGAVNTEFDEDFAYLNQTGEYLYFCSKGHNSMGGYDVFRAKYNRMTDTYDNPENLDFAISSPDDDILFLVDQQGEYGFFASSRQSETGKIYVYKIKIEKIPVQLCIIAGKFQPKINPSAKLLVEVVEVATGEVVGNYQSDEVNNIVFTFPRGGTYQYNMRIIGSERLWQERVEIPVKNELRPLRQYIEHTTISGNEVLRIVDRFEEEVEESDEIIAEIFSRKAALDPNSDKYDLNNRFTLNEEKVLRKFGSRHKKVEDLSKELSERTKKVQYNGSKASAYEAKKVAAIEEKVAQYDSLQGQLTRLEEEYKKAKTTKEEEEIMEEAQVLINELNALRDEILLDLENANHFKMAASLSMVNPETAEKWLVIGQKLNGFLEEGNKSEALQFLAANSDQVKDALEVESKEFYEKNSERVHDFDAKMARLQENRKAFLVSLGEIEREILELESRKESAKRAKLEELEKDLLFKKQELALTKGEITSIDNRLGIMEREKKELTEVLSAYQSEFAADAPMSENNLDMLEMKLRAGDFYLSNDLSSFFKEEQSKQEALVAEKKAKLLSNLDQIAQKNDQEGANKNEQFYKNSFDENSPESQLISNLAERLEPNFLIENDSIRSIITGIDFKKSVVLNESFLKKIDNEQSKLKSQGVSDLDPRMRELALAHDYLKTKNEYDQIGSELSDKTREDYIRELIGGTRGEKLIELSDLTVMSDGQINDFERIDVDFIDQLERRIKKVATLMDQYPTYEALPETKQKLELILVSEKLLLAEKRQMKLDQQSSVVTENKLDQLPKSERDQLLKEESKLDIVNRVSGNMFDVNPVDEKSLVLKTNSIEENERRLATSEKLLSALQEEQDRLKTIELNDERAEIIEKKKQFVDELVAQQVAKVQEERELLNDQRNEALNEIARLQESQQKRELNEEKAKQKAEELAADKKASELIQKESINASINEFEQIAKAKDSADMKMMAAFQPEGEPLKGEDATYKTRKRFVETAYGGYFREEAQLLENKNLSETEVLDKKIALNQELLEGLEKVNNYGLVKPEDRPTLVNLIADVKETTEGLKAERSVLPETRDQLIRRMEENYQSEVASLNEQKPNVDQLNSLNKIDQNLIAQLDAEKNRIQSLSSEELEETKKSKKLAEIELVKSQLQNDIVARNQQAEDFARLSNETLKEIRKSTTASKEAISYMEQLRPIESVDDLRRNILNDKEGVMTKTPTNYEVLNETKDALLDYKVDLESIMDAYDKDLKHDYTESTNLVLTEMGNVESRLDKVNEEIKTIEDEKAMYEGFVQTPEISLKFNDSQLERLLAKDNDLNKRLLNSENPTGKDKRAYEKAKMNRLNRENDLMQKESANLENLNAINTKKVEFLTRESEIAQLNNETLKKQLKSIDNEVDVLQNAIVESSDLEEKNQLLQQVYLKQIEKQSLIELSYSDSKMGELSHESQNNVQSKKDVESRLRQLEIESSRLTAELTNNREQAKATTNNKEKSEFLKRQNELTAQIDLNKNQKEYYSDLLEKIPDTRVQALDPKAKGVELSFEEERRIAAMPSYKKAARLGFDAIELEEKIDERNTQLLVEKNKLKRLIQKEFSETSDTLESQIDATQKKITIQEKDLSNMVNALKGKRNELLNMLDTNDYYRLNMQNMIMRGVDPIYEMPEGEDIVAFPKEEFVFDENGTRKASDIPLNVSQPTGLVFRVQVGAFTKALPDEMFREFYPVDGELRPTGMTLYRAGFFKSHVMAQTAQSDIKRVGYKDAFVVAFCNSERITIREAKRLEITGGCSTKEQKEIMFQEQKELVAEAQTQAKLAQKDYSIGPNGETYDYYKVDYAVPSQPIENIKGMFYTIQIGVFNRPADQSLVKGLDELYTRRLPNGQIRYSTGLYPSLREAVEAKKLVNQKGYTDAFIVVYNEGERLSLVAAQELLKENGPSILEKKTEYNPVDTTFKNYDNIVVQNDSYQERNETEKDHTDDVQSNVANRVQIVSKKEYDEFPREILNRFNSHAPFYYDANDKKIKSPVYRSVQQIPQIYFLRNEIDTVFMRVDEVAKSMETENSNRNLVIELSGKVIEGDLANTLLHMNYRKEYYRKENGIVEIELADIPADKVEQTVQELEGFGLTGKVIAAR